MDIDETINKLNQLFDLVIPFDATEQELRSLCDRYGIAPVMKGELDV